MRVVGENVVEAFRHKSKVEGIERESKKWKMCGEA